MKIEWANGELGQSQNPYRTNLGQCSVLRPTFCRLPTNHRHMANCSRRSDFLLAIMELHFTPF